MKTFTRDQHTFSAIDQGEKNQEVIILLHGFPANAASWSIVAGTLHKSGYRVLVPEQRGYSSGARPRQRRAYSVHELVEDVAALITASGVKQVHIVGHDWGGAIAWALASKYPQLVASLVVVSTPHPKALLKSLGNSKQLLLSWYMLFFQLPYVPEWLLSRKNGKALVKALTAAGLNHDTALEYAQNMQDKQLLTGAINWYRGIPFSIADIRDIAMIKPRTLLIYGGQDNYLSAKAALLTSTWVSGQYQLVHLPVANHWIPEESPALLADMLLSFIRAKSVTKES